MWQGCDARRPQCSSGLCTRNIKPARGCGCLLPLVLSTHANEKGIYPPARQGGPFRNSSLSPSSVMK
ncbi:hypothetical protein ID866_10261 [Astraeus odoratus]|nr:hypothetical protein ID866_10261 [Astraeus odoratus]